jgi:DNA-directed RNA polymerase I subunit RPA49
MTTVVKSLKRESVETIGDKNAAARNKLGQAFGTKKRKQAIKAQEQNVVNVDGLSGVSSRIKDVIATNMPVVPLKDELASIEMADRLIPPCNLNVLVQ